MEEDNDMFELREIYHPTFILMIVGFFISFMSLCVGISIIDMMLKQLDIIENNGTPIFDVMKNNGVTLSFEIYLFSIVNCLVSTDYWIINKERELCIYKAFGWSNKDLIKLIMKEILFIPLICLLLSVFAVVTVKKSRYLSIEINIFFVVSVIILLIITLFISLIIPVYRILKLSPSDVVK